MDLTTVCQKVAQLQTLSLPWQLLPCPDQHPAMVNFETVSLMAVLELECHQEETDTHLFLHAQHAASSGSAVVIIRSPDTAIAVTGCSLAAQIPAQAGTHNGTIAKERRRYISLSSVATRRDLEMGCAKLCLQFACSYRVRHHKCIFQQRQKGCLQNAPSWES